jgi:hypothetical protein
MILQSDNGRKVVAQVIEQVMAMWMGVIIVHGCARHPQTQGSIERANQDVEQMVGNWLKDNNTRNWVLGLNFVQIAKNKRMHSGVGSPPYTLQYGQKCRYSVSNLPINKDMLIKITSEEDLIAAMGAITFVTANTVTEDESVVPKAANTVPETANVVPEAADKKAANVVPDAANVMPQDDIVLLKGETVVPEAVPKAANLVPETNVTMPEDEKNSVLAAKEKCTEITFVLAVIAPSIGFALLGTALTMKPRGMGRSIGVRHAFLPAE